MWYLVHVETGVALSSENGYSFFVTCCVFADDSPSERVRCVCIYACVNVSVYVKPILIRNDDDTHPFSRPRALFLKNPILRFVEQINAEFPFLHNEKPLNQHTSFSFYYHQIYYVTQNWFIQIRNIMILSQNDFMCMSLKIIHRNLLFLINKNRKLSRHKKESCK